ncbi:MAG: 1-acyl-sn-glycerol-3-phosphate acyltransferase [Candidatus Aphodosoma sp.]
MYRNERFQIDIQEIVKAKVPRKLPRWLVTFLKKRIHQDEINECIMNAEHPRGIKFFDEALKYLDIKYTVRGAENLPAPGHRCIFAGNHPLGGPEALILGSVMHKYYGESFRVPVNNILAHFHPLAEFFIPVNVFSSQQNRDTVQNISDMFDSPYQVLVYPAGKCARYEHGKVTEQPWKKMFVTQARKYRRDVVPIHMSGRNSWWFYTLTKLSKMIGLKFNIGMFLLVDELFRKRHKTFVFTFGKPIPWTTYDKTKTDTEWAEWTRLQVADLEKGNGEKQNV